MRRGGDAKLRKKLQTSFKKKEQKKKKREKQKHTQKMKLIYIASITKSVRSEM
jgi:hypothetical protein